MNTMYEFWNNVANRVEPWIKDNLPFLQFLVGTGALIGIIYGVCRWLRRTRTGIDPITRDQLTTIEKQDPYFLIPSDKISTENLRASRLLWPDYRVAPYMDTHGQLVEVVRWCQEGDASLKVRVYVGSGGVR